MAPDPQGRINSNEDDMVDFVGDILRNAYNADAAAWQAPKVTTYTPTAGSRTVGGGMSGGMPSAYISKLQKQMLANSADKRGDQMLTGKDRAYLDSLRGTPIPSTTQKYWTVNGQEFTDQAAANARAAELNAAEQAKAQNPFLSEGQAFGLPGMSANELLHSGYIDDISQAKGLVFDPQSSYNAQRAIALDQFGDDALTRLLTEAAAPGTDVSQYATMDRLNPLISRIDAGINLTDDASTKYDFSGFLNDQAAQDIVNSIVTGERDAVRQSVNEAGNFGYDPTTGTSEFSRGLFSDTLDDALISEILGGQQSKATNTLDRALGYGQISQSGYDAALDALTGQYSAAQNRIGDYSTSLLEDYRGTTDQDIANLYNQIGGLKLGQNFDATGAVSDITGGAQKRVGDFEGALREQVGGEQFFDIGKLLAEGAKGSGIFDPIKEGSAGGLLGSMEDREKRQQQQRGLGSQGSF